MIPKNLPRPEKILIPVTNLPKHRQFSLELNKTIKRVVRQKREEEEIRVSKNERGQLRITIEENVYVDDSWVA